MRSILRFGTRALPTAPLRRVPRLLAGLFLFLPVCCGFSPAAPSPIHPWGRPAAQDTALIILSNRAYDCGYSPTLFVARWSAYAYTHSDSRKASRHSGRFRADPRLGPTFGPIPRDYQGLYRRDLTGFDRGHQAPDASLKVFGSEVQAETYFLSNITPQYSRFNQGFWRLLEDRTRDWAWDKDTVWVVTGPVFYADRDTARVGIEDRVCVPHAYFQVVARKRPDRSVGLIVPHRAEPIPWDSAAAFVVGIDSIARLTGLELFPGLTDRGISRCGFCWPGLFPVP